MTDDNKKPEENKIDVKSFVWKVNFGVKVLDTSPGVKFEGRGEGYASSQGYGIQLVPFYPYIWPKY